MPPPRGGFSEGEFHQFTGAAHLAQVKRLPNCEVMLKKGGTELGDAADRTIEPSAAPSQMSRHSHLPRWEDRLAGRECRM